MMFAGNVARQPAPMTEMEMKQAQLAALEVPCQRHHRHRVLVAGAEDGAPAAATTAADSTTRHGHTANDGWRPAAVAVWSADAATVWRHARSAATAGHRWRSSRRFNRCSRCNNQRCVCVCVCVCVCAHRPVSESTSTVARLHKNTVCPPPASCKIDR